MREIQAISSFLHTGIAAGSWQFALVPASRFSSSSSPTVVIVQSIYQGDCCSRATAAKLDAPEAATAGCHHFVSQSAGWRVAGSDDDYNNDDDESSQRGGGFRVQHRSVQQQHESAQQPIRHGVVVGNDDATSAHGEGTDATFRTSPAAAGQTEEGRRSPLDFAQSTEAIDDATAATRGRRRRRRRIVALAGRNSIAQPGHPHRDHQGREAGRAAAAAATAHES